MNDQSMTYCRETFTSPNLLNDRTEDFVKAQVAGRGLDDRTAKAYRLDLQHLYLWAREHEVEQMDHRFVESYLEYLVKERKLKYSTIIRKYRVFSYYLKYLTVEGQLPDCHAILCPAPAAQENQKAETGLSRAEIDTFFAALNREYENLDNEFRKRVCLRDCVMMELLFYHGLEISELLQLRVTDYNLKTGILTIQGKRGKERSEYLFSRQLRGKMECWVGERVYFEKENAYHNILFLSKIGKPLSMKMVILVFEKYRVMAGIETRSTPKDLKHSMKRYAREMMVESCS